MNGEPLRVAFDLSTTRLADAGVARSARELSTALAERDDLQVIPIGAGDRPHGHRRRALAVRLDLEWSLRGARSAARRERARVLHFPLPRGPIASGSPPTAVTIHDLAAVRHPETLSRWNRAYTRRMLPRVLRAADAVIAVSNDTAADLAAWLPAVASRIHVVPNGVGSFWSEPDDAHDAGVPFVLVVGTPEPRKNLPRLVEAMRRRRADGAPEILIHVGADGWGGIDLPDEPWIQRRGRVADIALRSLYRGCAAVAIPSLHEGSGLPVLEAFAAGAPVVAATSGALPETCGDAAVLVDPHDPDAIAAGIDRAIANRDLLVPAGRLRAERSTWARSAADCAAVYRAIA